MITFQLKDKNSCDFLVKVIEVMVQQLEKVNKIKEILVMFCLLIRYEYVLKRRGCG